MKYQETKFFQEFKNSVPDVDEDRLRVTLYNRILFEQTNNNT